MNNIKTEHTEHRVNHIWMKTYDSMQDHANHQLLDNIIHPLRRPMQGNLAMHIQEHIQNRVREYINAQY